MYFISKIFQRDVTVQIETADKSFNNVIGWLFLENKTNLSIALVEEGLATLHSASAEKYVLLEEFIHSLLNNKNILLGANTIEPSSKQKKKQRING